jgi:hypothetical protein
MASGNGKDYLLVSLFVLFGIDRGDNVIIFRIGDTHYNLSVVFWSTFCSFNGDEQKYCGSTFIHGSGPDSVYGIWLRVYKEHFINGYQQ